MPPAANARALDPGRLTLTPFGSRPVGEPAHVSNRLRSAVQQHAASC
ncbi:MAG: hypothetical protein LBQ54_13910 [Planctomycetaceae bacterium]|nr:hypothetical protein [Planctomycetaceae bacterium]